LDSYLSLDAFQVFKLHGSVSWFRERGIGAISPGESTLAAATRLAGEGLDFQGGEIVAREPTDMPPEGTQLLVPAMAIPMADKSALNAPRRIWRNCERI
jgi:hypothetical protein